MYMQVEFVLAFNMPYTSSKPKVYPFPAMDRTRNILLSLVSDTVTSLIKREPFHGKGVTDKLSTFKSLSLSEEDLTPQGETCQE